MRNHTAKLTLERVLVQCPRSLKDRSMVKSSSARHPSDVGV